MKISVRHRSVDPRSLVQEQFEALAGMISGCGSGSLGSCTFLDHYRSPALEGIPDSVTRSVLACGDPVDVARAQPGEIVLDLGCGAGLDCFLVGRAVGPEGHVVGIDMTGAMLKLARRNAAEVGCSNVSFCQAHIEEVPVGDGQMDLVISNSTINLSPAKERVFNEMFRVLRPGGRFAICDMVFEGAVPEAVKLRVFAWAGCVSGTLTAGSYTEKLAAAGFENVAVESRTSYGLDRFDSLDDASREYLSEGGGWTPMLPSDGLFSIRITGRRPEICVST